MDCPKCGSKDKFFGEGGLRYCSHCGFHFADTVEDIKEQISGLLSKIGFKENTLAKSVSPDAGISFEREGFSVFLLVQDTEVPIKKTKVVDTGRTAQDIEDFSKHVFSTGATTGEDFNLFAKLFKKYIESQCRNGMKLVSFSIGHYILSGFIERTGKFIYFSISDVRHFPNEWLHSILIRTAKSVKDYTGGFNSETSLSLFEYGVEHLFKSMEGT